MSIRQKAIGVFAATTAAVAIPMTIASPSQAATVTPANIITYNVSNDCAVYSANCNGYKDGTPNWGMFVFYHSISYSTGGYAQLYGNIADYAYSEVAAQGVTYHYHYVYQASGGTGGSDGAGSGVKNNAASVDPYGTDNYRVYYFSGFTGHSQLFTSRYHGPSVNLDSTLKNENASQHFA
jgi:hypothetical protein